MIWCVCKLICFFCFVKMMEFVLLNWFLRLRKRGSVWKVFVMVRFLKIFGILMIFVLFFLRFWWVLVSIIGCCLIELIWFFYNWLSGFGICFGDVFIWLYEVVLMVRFIFLWIMLSFWVMRISSFVWGVWWVGLVMMKVWFKVGVVECFWLVNRISCWLRLVNWCLVWMLKSWLW